jgi:RNA polymerase-binding transcription factor DksA
VKKSAPVTPAKKPLVAKSVAPKSVAAPAKATPAYVKPAIKQSGHVQPAALVSKNSVPVKPIVSAPKPVTKEEPKKSIIPTTMPAKSEPKKIVPPAKPVKVVIPEMKSKTVRKYEPEFTKSVLDTLHEEQTGPTMRYSDSELGEFRELINRKLDAAKKELAYLQGLITRKDEMGGDNDDARYMTMEDGSMSMEREQLSQMASRQITFIDHLEKAIMRIENKTYGICRVTGKLIDKARLRAVPHATLSIEAKQMMNK